MNRAGVRPAQRGFVITQLQSGRRKIRGRHARSKNYRAKFIACGADAIFTASFFHWFNYAAGLGSLWGLVLTIQIALKTDPIYDMLGTWQY